MDPVCVTAEGEVVPNPQRAVEGGRTARYADSSNKDPRSPAWAQ